MNRTLYTLVMYALLFLGLYFFLIRPQKKRVKEAQNMLNELELGDTIVTIGGLYGVISEIDETAGTIVLECDGIYLTFDRRAVRQVISKAESKRTTSVEDLKPEEDQDAKSEESPSVADEDEQD